MNTRPRLLVLTAVMIAMGIVLLRKLSPNDAPRPASEATEPPMPLDPREISGEQSAAIASARQAAEGGRHDRKKRDALREALMRTFPDASAASASPRSASERGPGFRTASSQEEYAKFIQQVVREDMFPLAKSCYENLLKRQPDAGGRVVLSFELLSDESVGGIVNDAVVDDSSTLRNKDFDECITESLSSLYFDHPPAKGRTTVKYPIVFATDPEGDRDD